MWQMQDGKFLRSGMSRGWVACSQTCLQKKFKTRQSEHVHVTE